METEGELARETNRTKQEQFSQVKENEPHQTCSEFNKKREMARGPEDQEERSWRTGGTEGF